MSSGHCTSVFGLDIDSRDRKVGGVDFDTVKDSVRLLTSSARHIKVSDSESEDSATFGRQNKSWTGVCDLRRCVVDRCLSHKADDVEHVPLNAGVYTGVLARHSGGTVAVFHTDIHR